LPQKLEASFWNLQHLPLVDVLKTGSVNWKYYGVGRHDEGWGNL
jgi:hypothetical protein